jgi:rRNA-processing protein FCF1
LIKGLIGCGLTTTEAVDEVVRYVADVIKPPVDLVSFQRLCAAIRSGPAAWRVPYPSGFYSADVLKAIAAVFDDDGLAYLLANGNAFDTAVIELQNLFVAVDSTIQKTGAVSLLKNKARHDALRRTKHWGAIRVEAERWKAAYTRFAATFPEIVPHLADTALETAHLRVMHALTGHVPRQNGEEPFERVLVVDTSALIDRPILPDHLTERDLLVVPQRVVEELDNVKKRADESLRAKISIAIRTLKNVPRWRVEFVASDTSQLPADYDNKGDNRILSVALKYRDRQPILVTNDQNLQLKAFAAGIKSKPADEI